LRGMCPYSFLKPREEVQSPPPATFAKARFRAMAGESPSLEKDPGHTGQGGPSGKRAGITLPAAFTPSPPQG
jgi:hypothetical protein